VKKSGCSERCDGFGRGSYPDGTNEGFTIKVLAPGIKDQLPIATGLLTILEALGGDGRGRMSEYCTRPRCVCEHPWACVLPSRIPSRSIARSFPALRSFRRRI
jgi:hypothetical protein